MPPPKAAQNTPPTAAESSNQQPRVDILFPKLPPALDGIGDHTARFAEALADHAEVRVLTAQPDAHPVPGVTVERAFSLDRRRGIRAIVDAVVAQSPDWLLLQFNQFSYGRWGLNPHVPLTLRQLKQQQPTLQVAVMFHEDFVPVTSWRNAVMTTWQRGQFWAIGRAADHIFFSIDPWVRRYQSWFPDTPVRHLPVGSNIPRTNTPREAVRRQLGLDEGTCVAGVFGTVHASRLLPHIRQAARALQQHTSDFTLLYIGPDGTALQEAMPEVPVRDAGRLPAQDVSRHFATMDLQLTPFIDGVSTRRGSFMTGLQHGIPTVATVGPLTDALLHEADGQAFMLTSVDAPEAFAEAAVRLWKQPTLRDRMASASRALYDQHFDFSVTALQFARAIQEVTP